MAVQNHSRQENPARLTVQPVAPKGTDTPALQRLASDIADMANELAMQLNKATPSQSGEPSGSMVAASRETCRRDLIEGNAPMLPAPCVLRRIIRQRRMRAEFFDGALFADPAWDMLLDLTVAHVEKTRVSVTSLCIASGVPSTTALRWIGQLVEVGLLRRIEDNVDRRRAFIELTDRAADAMARYFAQMGADFSQRP